MLLLSTSMGEVLENKTFQTYSVMVTSSNTAVILLLFQRLVSTLVCVKMNTYASISNGF